jgi:hypothetical protein
VSFDLWTIQLRMEVNVNESQLSTNGEL